jgi:hypothetical protein
MHKKYSLNTILLIVVVLLLITLIVKNTTNYVIAQGDGSTRHVFGVVGERLGNRQPFYLVDTSEQTIMIYEYFQGGGLGLAAVRSYKYDKNLQQYGKLYGLSVEDVKTELLKAQTKQPK